MTEDDLRTTFVRHEYLTPAVEEVRAAIAAGIARRRVRRRAAWSGGAVFAVVLATLVPVTAARLLVATPPPPSPAALNFLLVGYDERPGSGPPRADAIVVAHVDRARQKLHLVSIPRDLYLAPNHKINAEYTAGGMDRLAATVTRLTGVPLDGTVAVSFAGFMKVTDAVGGVRMCVDRRVESVHIGVDRDGNFLAPSRGGRPYVHEVGCRNFAGWQALDYVRQRALLRNGSIDRDKHIREYLIALFDKLISSDTLTNPARIAQVVSSAGSALTVDGPNLAALAAEVHRIGASDVGSLTVPVELAEPSGFRLGAGAEDLFAALREDRLG
jgi:LCP family protein required for cell wall assembly